MKRLLLSIMAVLMLGVAVNAQPTKRRVKSSAQTTKKANASTSAATTSDRAALMFPSSAAMPEDVVWKRDVYRQLDLLKDKNAPMYYPVEPIGHQVNLFTYLFRLVLTGRVQAYRYKLDGTESFEEKDKLEVRSLLEDQSIYFEEKDGKFVVADSDLPSSEVTRFYIKESIYFDQRTGTFSTRVSALCPVLMRGADEFTTEATPYPLFWVQYSDVASWLARLPMMGSNLNNISNLTADDFFTLNRYDGKIYKTNNLQGRVLANYCQTDSDMVKEQAHIEKQIADFEKGIWGHATDSTKNDSLEMTQKKVKKTIRSSASSSADSRRRSGNAGSAKQEKSSASSAPRVSARRQRR